MKGIYQYTDLKTGKIVYVGKDSHIDKNTRHKQHLHPSRYNDQPFNRILQNNFERYKYEVIYAGDFDEDLLNVLEINTIAKENPKFNFTKGGDGILGYKHSDETKQKMSKNNAWKGKTRSDKTKKKISEAKKGKEPWNKGKTHSEETKIKMSKARNSSGYLNVIKCKDKTCKNGFIWKYQYSEGGKQKSIASVDIKKLEAKVINKGLKWEKIILEG